MTTSGGVKRVFFVYVLGFILNQVYGRPYDTHVNCDLTKKNGDYILSSTATVMGFPLVEVTEGTELVEYVSNSHHGWVFFVEFFPDKKYTLIAHVSGGVFPNSSNESNPPDSCPEGQDILYNKTAGNFFVVEPTEKETVVTVLGSTGYGQVSYQRVILNGDIETVTPTASDLVPTNTPTSSSPETANPTTTPTYSPTKIPVATKSPAIEPVPTNFPTKAPSNITNPTSSPLYSATRAPTSSPNDHDATASPTSTPGWPFCDIKIEFAKAVSELVMSIGNCTEGQRCPALINLLELLEVANTNGYLDFDVYFRCSPIDFLYLTRNNQSLTFAEVFDQECLQKDDYAFVYGGIHCTNTLAFSPLGNIMKSFDVNCTLESKYCLSTIRLLRYYLMGDIGSDCSRLNEDN